ncbi:aldehyde reductase [Oceanicoccus sp. KOV_DT_Chl]|uniref:SDR family oxidoreductase n=1 Tax=Oceanicoccus sp. KOV_DT_Chl TaxID=1904639 RepID=UPI00135BE220|nr:aldehyde reductase [Oceanicoccus sp. KOV_DT_Chl]
MERVLVTGATGFIGLHCIAQLLEQGYIVRGTVRSLESEPELRQALSKQGINHDNLNLVEVDLGNAKGWQAAMTDCDYVLHIASPFFIGEPDNPEYWINLATEGTLRVLRTASAAGVKKTVLTSSCGAITENNKSSDIFTENDWTDPHLSRLSTYFKSKTLAERAAWDFVSKQEKDSNMALTCIHPSMIIGPSLSNDIGISNQLIEQLITGAAPATIALHFGYVDVRDVAAAHILAMKNKRSDGHRFIISEQELWIKDAARLLRDQGYSKAPRFELPNALAYIFMVFNRDLKSSAKILGQKRITPADKAKRILDWYPRDIRLSLIETAQQIQSKPQLL